MYPTAVQTIVDQWSKSLGFSKHGGTWYFEGESAGIAIQCQKSQYGPRYFLNLGIWERALIAESWPKVEACHAFGRMSGGAEDHSLADLLNEEYVLDIELRTLGLRSILDEQVASLLSATSSIEQLVVEPVIAEFFRHALISRDAPRAFDRFVENS